MLRCMVSIALSWVSSHCKQTRRVSRYISVIEPSAISRGLEKMWRPRALFTYVLETCPQSICGLDLCGEAARPILEGIVET